MPAMTRGSGRVLKITCNEPSHGGREWVIAEFQEELDATGKRLNIVLLRQRKVTRDGLELWTVPRNDMKVGEPEQDGRIRLARNRRPLTTRATAIDTAGGTIGSYRDDDALPLDHWHYQLTCRCGRNVPARSTTLMPVLATLFDHQVTTIHLAPLAARLQSKVRPEVAGTTHQ